MTFGRYASMLSLFFTGEFGIRKVLFEEVAELGVKVEDVAACTLLPKIEDATGAGVPGFVCAMLVYALIAEVV